MGTTVGLSWDVDDEGTEEGAEGGANEEEDDDGVDEVLEVGMGLEI